MKIAALAILSALAFSSTAFSQESQRVSQEEAITLLKGKQLNGINPRWTARFDFKEDGTVQGAGSAGSDTGTYTVTDGKLCLKWARKWKDACGALLKAPDGTISQVLEDGSPWITFKN